MNRKLKPQISESTPKRIRQSRAARRCGVTVGVVSDGRAATVLMTVTMAQTTS
jgi:hypothetical protein